MSKAKKFIPAQMFHPGFYIREELEERGWTQAQFAKVIGRPLPAVNEIINGKKIIIVETAKAIGLAFGTSAQFWLNLENAYRLHSTPNADPMIGVRAAKLSAA